MEISSYQQRRSLVSTVARLVRFAFATAMLMATFAPAAAAQGLPLVGFVRDELGKPIEGAEIMLGSREIRTRTDEYGRFLILGAPMGLTYVAARHLGFLPVADLMRISPSDTIEFVLDRIGYRADTVRVSARAEAAWERDVRRYEWARDAARNGFVLTDRDIAKRAPVWTTDLLVSRPGFQVVGSGAQSRVVGNRSRCTPLLIVDGQPLVAFNVNDIMPSTIKVMITYASAAALPIELQTMRGNLNCGVVAIISQ